MYANKFVLVLVFRITAYDAARTAAAARAPVTNSDRYVLCTSGFMSDVIFACAVKIYY